jgi:hypothetical protein
MHTIRTTLLALCAAGCAQVTPRHDHFVHDELEAPPAVYHLQGMLGVTDFRDVDVDIDGASEADAPTLPLLGGAVQYPMLGDRNGSRMRARVGLEAGMTFGYDGNTDIFFVDNGIAVVRSEDRLFVADLFGGPYADLLFGDTWRLYGGLGPLIQYGSIDVEYDDGAGGITELDDDGFGLGWHARMGLELRITNQSFIGLGVRWVDTEIDFGGGIGDLDYEAVQVALTMTSGF